MRKAAVAKAFADIESALAVLNAEVDGDGGPASEVSSEADPCVAWAKDAWIFLPGSAGRRAASRD
jgi:hypothetical protein